MENDPRIRFSLTQLLVLVACVAGILAVGRYNPGLAVLLSLVFAGWTMRRYGHGHWGGTIPSLFGLFIMAGHAFESTQSSREPFLADISRGFGALVTAIGIFIFICVAAAERPFWRSQLILAACVATALIGCWVIVPNLGNANLAQRRADDVASNKAAMVKSVEQIEAVCKRLGRVPEKWELRELLDEPLPSFQWDGHKGQIEYYSVSNSTYRLSCYLNWEIYHYDSATPKRGWYSEPF